MTKHRMPEKRRTSKTLAVAMTAAGLSGGLVFGHATNATLANLDVALSGIIGVGGATDSTSDRVDDKFNCKFVCNAGAAYGTYPGNYVMISYPADYNFQGSVNDGVPKLQDAIDDDQEGPDKTRVVSYSEGTLVAEQVKRNLAAQNPANPPYANDLDFVFIASPYVPNGGLFGRFPGFVIPGLVPQFSAAEATAYDSTYIYNEYDGISDFPAYFNPLAIANALLGIVYAHPDQYYDGDISGLVEGEDYYKTEVENDAGGTDTYIMIRNEHLPLFAPIRQLADALGVEPQVEPVLKAIEPLFRVMIDAGYTDRTNEDPGTPTPFSLITPPGKIIEAITKVPAAIQEGIEDATAPNITTLDASVQNNQRKLDVVPQTITPTIVDEDEKNAGDGTKPEDKGVVELGDADQTPEAPKPPKVKTPKPGQFLREVAKAVERIVKPKVVSDGNKATPGSTVDNKTGGSTGGGSTTPEPEKAPEPSDPPKTESEAA